MVFQSTAGYLLAFIICRGESNNQSEPLEEFYKPFDNYSNPSDMILLMMPGFYNMDFVYGFYCVILHYATHYI